MSFTVSFEFQFACFALAALLSFSLLAVIMASEFVGFATHFAVIRWVCEKTSFCGLDGHEWFAALMFFAAFGVTGIAVTLLGIPFPHSFYISFIAGCLWAYHKLRD